MSYEAAVPSHEEVAVPQLSQEVLMSLAKELEDKQQQLERQAATITLREQEFRNTYNRFLIRKEELRDVLLELLKDCLDYQGMDKAVLLRDVEEALDEVQSAKSNAEDAYSEAERAVSSLEGAERALYAVQSSLED